MATASHQDQLDTGGTKLLNQLGKVRRRAFSIGTVAAIGWMLVVIIGVFLIAAWLDLLWDLSAPARLTSLAAAVTVGAALFLLMLVTVVKKTNGRSVAARLDHAGQTGGEIESGLDLSNSLQSNNSTNRPSHANARLESGLAALAINRAANTATQIDLAQAIPTKPIKLVAAVLGGIGLLLAVCYLTMPKLAKTQWSRFVAPSVETPPFSTIEFEVLPGDVEKKYGQDIDITATVSSAVVDELELVIHDQDTDEVVPMFLERDNRWRATLFRITKPVKYSVRSGRARSKTYDVSVVLVPEIKDVQFRLTPPAYTRLGPTQQPARQGIDALIGTKVEVMAASNRPLSGGQLKIKLKNQVETIELQPRHPEQSNEVVGEFEVSQPGKFSLQLTDESGITSTDSVAGSITLIPDTKPFVRMLSPKQNSWATATVQLPIAIEAEDDFGISSLSLYRSLNDSRPLAQKFEVPAGVRRWNARTFLPLAEYDLQPGDKLELFSRVEDTDPTLIKGSESPIHVVHIISRQQYEQLNRDRLGIESVFAKYRQIQRSLESLEVMQREIEAMEDEPQPDNKPSDTKKQKIAQAAQTFKQKAREFQQLLEQRQPIDFDEDLQSRIEEMSDQMIEISREIRKLVRDIENDEIDNEKLKQRLQELREKLEGIRDKFEKEVIEPLDGLGKIFPLINLQQSFVQLVLRQRNLADRVKALDGSDNPDDPAIKRRLRDLSDEQQQLRERLDNVLFEIENQAFSLPLGDEFTELRDSALKFVDEVAESGAMDQQQKAQTEMAEFSGTGGYKHAAEAAKILESFVDSAEGINDMGEGVARAIFDPKFNRPRFGNSMQQLKDLFGPKNGNQRQGGSNRGIYGDDPVAEQRQKSGSSGDRRSGAIYGSRPGGQSGSGGDVQRIGGSTGAAQATIPLRYKQKVGQYYRRIVDELGDQ